MDYIQKIRILYGLPEKNDYGYTENEIITTENDLGIKFPKILHDYYFTVGKNK